jgi:hypothetical protein
MHAVLASPEKASHRRRRRVAVPLGGTAGRPEPGAAVPPPLFFFAQSPTEGAER